MSSKETAKRWREKNKERRKKLKNDWAKTEKGKACRRRYYEANIEKLRAYGRAYYHAHKANPTAETGTPRPARPRPRPPARPEPDIREQLRQEQAARQARIAAKRAQYARLQQTHAGEPHL